MSAHPLRTALVAGAATLAVLATSAPTLSAQASPGLRAGSGVGSGRWNEARSTLHRDTVYPRHGAEVVDALHYGLKLDWHDASTTLTGHERLTFRAARNASHFSLELIDSLVVGSATLDGRPVSVTQSGDRVRLTSPVARGSRHVLSLTYAGVPHAVPAPTERGDFSTLGFTAMPDGSVWTMQEPFGAYTWYAVNDTPADKAYYDFRITAPPHMVGVANGRLVSRSVVAGHTHTDWHLDAPCASYLTTLAIGDYVRHVIHGVKGLPIDLWTHRGDARELRVLSYAPRAVRFLRKQVGRYPFSTLGIVAVPSASAMETETMVTMGTLDHVLTKDNVVHEIAHQWYGDTVTPRDWSDLWMNEGMAFYLAEGRWTAHHEGISLSDDLSFWASQARRIRREEGPPAAYDPSDFGEINVYVLPALMWDTLRHRLGSSEFDTLARRWPATHARASSSRGQLVRWWSHQTHLDLRGFFHRWLLGAKEPPWHAS
jgi:aminopeptidase N